MESDKNTLILKKKCFPIVSFYQRELSYTFAADSVPSLITEDDNLHDCYDENE